jgi:seryl-tRNA synthetase
MAYVTRAEFEELKNKRKIDFDYFYALIEDLPNDIFKLEESMKVHNTNAHNQNIINQRARDDIGALAARMDSMRAQIKELNTELNILDSKLGKVTSVATKKRTRKNGRKN